MKAKKPEHPRVTKIRQNIERMEKELAVIVAAVKKRRAGKKA